MNRSFWLSRLDQSPDKLCLSCSGFHVYAGGVLKLTGTYEDDDTYLIKSVRHTIDSSGWNISMDIAN